MPRTGPALLCPGLAGGAGWGPASRRCWLLRASFPDRRHCSTASSLQTHSGRRWCERRETALQPRQLRQLGACRGRRSRLCREARARKSASLLRCCGEREGGHCGRGSTARVWRDLPLELVLQIRLVIPLPPALAGDLPQDARHHLPQGLVCPWGKAPATARTKSLSPFSCDPPASSRTQPHTYVAPFGPTAPLRQEEFQAPALAPAIGL